MSENTRERLVEAAYHLFILKGFGSTRVDEICASAQASKGSFYHSFKSKEAIGLAAFDRYYEAVWERLLAGPYVTEQNPEKRLSGFLNHSRTLASELLKGGSLLTTLATELPGHSDEFSSRVRERAEILVDSLAEAFEGLDLPGRIQSPNDLALIYLSMLEGAVTMARLTGKRDLIDQAIEAFRRFALSGEDE